jgi:hypothetical protein
VEDLIFFVTPLPDETYTSSPIDILDSTDTPAPSIVRLPTLTPPDKKTPGPNRQFSET